MLRESRNPQSITNMLNLAKIASAVGPMRSTLPKNSTLGNKRLFLIWGIFFWVFTHRGQGRLWREPREAGERAAWRRARRFRGAEAQLAGVRGLDVGRGLGESGRSTAGMSRRGSDRLRLKNGSGQKARVGE